MLVMPYQALLVAGVSAVHLYDTFEKVVHEYSHMPGTLQKSLMHLARTKMLKFLEQTLQGLKAYVGLLQL